MLFNASATRTDKLFDNNRGNSARPTSIRAKEQGGHPVCSGLEEAGETPVLLCNS